MQEFISKKRIVKIIEHWNSKYTYMTQDWVQWTPQGSVYVAKDKIEGANWNMEIPTVTTIPEESKLVFHKTSKFPRHKLGLTTFKRKIREKGSDYLVGNFKKPVESSIVTWNNAYETDDTIYVTYCKTIDFSALDKDCQIYLANAKHYSNYQCFIANKEELFYIDYIQGKHALPVISDKDLNALVDNKQERISVDELSACIDMIKSQDKENANLALKLFAQFNLSADPLMSFVFLSIYSRYFYGINSVLYTNLKEQFKPNKNIWYGSLLSLLRTTYPKDDHEKDLINRILADYIVVGRLSVDTLLEFKNLGYKIEIDGL